VTERTGAVAYIALIRATSSLTTCVAFTFWVTLQFSG
jgi:hypothetical protein